MAAAPLCLDHPGAGLMTLGHCPRPASQASVREMEGSDALLAARLAAGDDRALAEVFDQLAPSVYGGALRVLGNGSAAQDVVQDVFVELWSHPDRYDPAAGPDVGALGHGVRFAAPAPQRARRHRVQLGPAGPVEQHRGHHRGRRVGPDGHDAVLRHQAGPRPAQRSGQRRAELAGLDQAAGEREARDVRIAEQRSGVVQRASRISAGIRHRPPPKISQAPGPGRRGGC